MPNDNTPAIGFQQLQDDTLGHFQWIFQNRKQAQRFADLGFLPDNNILSNKLINIYGKRVFEILRDKAQAVEENKSARKRLSLAIGNAHEDFGPSKQMELWLSEHMVKKIRALQAVDLLMSTTDPLVELFIAGKLGTLSTEIDQIFLLRSSSIPGPCAHVQKQIHESEKAQIEFLQEQFKKLQSILTSPLSLDERNAVLQQFQRDVFKRMNDDFQMSQGLIESVSILEHQSPTDVKVLARLLKPPVENTSGTNTYTDAKFAIREHVFSEMGPVSRDQLWDMENVGQSGTQLKFYSDVFSASTDAVETGMRFDSRIHLGDGGRCRQALLAAHWVAKHDVRTSWADIPIDTLKEARDQYRERKRTMGQATLDNKSKTGLKKSQQEAKRLKRAAQEQYYFHPTVKSYALESAAQKDDFAYADLLPAQRNFHQLWQEWKSRDRKHADMTKALGVLQEAQLNDPVTTAEGSTVSPASSSSSSHSPEQALETTEAHAPMIDFPRPQPVLLVRPDDILGAAGVFADQFFGYFHKQMAAKHPYLNSLFFLGTYAHFGTAAAGMAGNALFAHLSQALIHAEAAVLSKTGVPVTAEQIRAVTDAIVAKELWIFHAAGSPMDALITSGITLGKGGYTVADGVLNAVFGDSTHASTLSSVIAEAVASGTFNGLDVQTKTEIAQSVARVFAMTVLGAMLGAGVGLSVHSIITALPQLNMLSVFGDIPASLLWPITVPTVGAIQTAGVLAGKVLGVVLSIKHGNLVGIENEEQDISVIKQFLVWTEKMKQGQPPSVDLQSDAYRTVRLRFEALLAKNPWLRDEIFGDRMPELAQLQVKRVSDALLSRVFMAALRSPIYLAAFPFATALFVGQSVGAYLGLTKAPSATTRKYMLSTPLFLARVGFALARVLEFGVKISGKIVARVPEYSILLGTFLAVGVVNLATLPMAYGDEARKQRRQDILGAVLGAGVGLRNRVRMMRYRVENTLALVFSPIHKARQVIERAEQKGGFQPSTVVSLETVQDEKKSTVNKVGTVPAGVVGGCGSTAGIIAQCGGPGNGLGNTLSTGVFEPQGQSPFSPIEPTNSNASDVQPSGVPVPPESQLSHTTSR